MSTPESNQGKPPRPSAAPPAPRQIPAPRVLPESQAYWTAADEGRLLVKKCKACGEFHHYPRDVCPYCLSVDTEWRQAAGTGTVYSFSTMGKGEATYTLAFVTLEEGVTLMTNLVDCDPSTVAIGQPVRVVFKPSEGGHAVPMFTPA
jgi:uncharacterized OB-fold protein